MERRANIGVLLGCFGQSNHALTYAELFWPRFCLIDDCVLIGKPDQAILDQWLASAQRPTAT